MGDDRSTVRIDAEQVNEMVKRHPYVEPILQAVLTHDVPFMPIRQGTKPFEVPSTEKPWILFLQDDPKPGNRSLGPDGFDRRSLESAIQASSLAVVMACDPIEDFYALVADEATVNHNNAMLVETWLTHEDQWTRLIKRIKPDIQLALGTVRSGRA